MNEFSEKTEAPVRIVDFTAEDLDSITGATIVTHRGKDTVILRRGINEGSGLSLSEAIRSLKANMGIKD